ncbi:nucleotide-binding protein [Paraburkholderia fungorum]|uniref:nucleotide-binding protein n=1 Tax=Paraburkholderia fungorum TaxID=134537 RepID=UPI0038BB65B5
MDTTIPPIYLVGGSKGGVGKSFVSLALADYLQRQDIHAALVETDTSNPDVMKAVQDEMHCVAYSLDDADGWIGLVNFCDGHRDAAVIVNTAARNQAGVARFGAMLAGTLGELQRRLVVLWVINRQRDSLERLALGRMKSARDRSRVEIMASASSARITLDVPDGIDDDILGEIALKCLVFLIHRRKHGLNLRCSLSKADNCRLGFSVSVTVSSIHDLAAIRSHKGCSHWIDHRVGMPLRSACSIPFLSLACLGDQYSRPTPA